jgi:hypothetical protein
VEVEKLLQLPDLNVEVLVFGKAAAVVVVVGEVEAVKFGGKRAAPMTAVRMLGRITR